MPAKERTIGKLVLSVGGRVLREMLIDRKRVTIGRRPYNDLLLDDLTVSGEHAIVHTGPNGESVVHDLQSRNGTLVNGLPVMQQVLVAGDVIDVGIYRIAYQVEVLEFNVNDFAPRELPRASVSGPGNLPIERQPSGSDGVGRPGAAGAGDRPATGPAWASFLNRRRAAGDPGKGPAAQPGEGPAMPEGSTGFPPILPSASGGAEASSSALAPAPQAVPPSIAPTPESAPAALPPLQWPTSGTGRGASRASGAAAGPSTGHGDGSSSGQGAGSSSAQGAGPTSGQSANPPSDQGGLPPASQSPGQASGDTGSLGGRFRPIGNGPAGRGDSDAGGGPTPSFHPPARMPAVEPWRFGRVVIRYLGGHDAGREVVMDRPIVSIRNGSGQVAVVARRQGGYYLTHLEGLAYPMVNGESIGLGAHALRDNDLIELAGTILQFCLDSGSS